MADEKNSEDKFSKLRTLAEETLSSRQSDKEEISALSPEEIQRLIHELRVHQIELEMQNEDLRQAQTKLEEFKDKYLDLYDFAPVGYLTLNEKGLILEANLTVVRLMGVERKSLIKTFFSRFICPEDSDAYYLHLQQVLETQSKQTCEIRLARGDGTQLYAQLDSLPVQDESGQYSRCRTIVSDISERKRAEQELRSAHELLAIRNRIAEVFLTAPDAEMFSGVLDVLLAFTGSELGVFSYLDEDGAAVAPSMTKQVLEECQIPDKTIRFPRETWGDSIWARAILEKRSLYKNEPGKVPEGHVPIHSVLVVPIIFQDTVIGHFELANRPGGYSDAEKEVVEEICRYVAPVLHARLGRHRLEAQRKQAADALKESEERYRHLVEMSPDGIAVHQDGRIVFINAVGARMLGAESPDEIIGKPIREIIHPDSWEESRMRILPMLKGETGAHQLEDYYVKLDGTAFPVEAAISTVVHQGKPAVQVVARDITDRKRAEQEIRSNERRLQSLLRISQYECKDIHDLLDYALGQAIALTGSTIGWFGTYDEEAERLSISTWSSGAMKDCEIAEKPMVFPFENAGIWAECIRTRGPFTLNDYQRPNPGKKGYPEAHVELSRFLAAPLFSEDRIVAVVVVANKDNEYDETDVRQLTLLMSSAWRVARSRRMEEDQSRLATAIEQAAEGVIITDAEGTIHYVNPGVERMTGYSKDEVIGQTPRVFKSGEHDGLFYRQLWDTIKSGGTWSGRFVNRKKDGRLYHEDATITPVKNASGKIINFVAVKRDITEHFELSRQLLQAQKMESIGTLAGGIAHDFNNLLQVTLGYSELLLQEKTAEDPEYADLQKILHAARSGAKLVKGLLLFSRKTEPKAVVMKLNKQIVQVEGILRRTIPKMVDISLDLSPDLPEIYADPSQVEQVLMNLAVNARDAMLDGGKLTVRTVRETLGEEYCRVHVEANPGEHVLLEISDTGSGMDKETVKHMFEPFFTTKEKGRGTGLGLAMVYGIVKQHNGHVSVYSEVGKGTTFRVYFPAIESEVETDVETTGVMPAFGTETVLLVDDEDLVRELGARILTKHGYTVLQASNGREALKLFNKKRSRIALVILDLIMPAMGGTECLKELLKIDPQVNVLVASGYSADAWVKECGELGAKGFVAKPFRFKELLQQVRKTLDGE